MAHSHIAHKRRNIRFKGLWRVHTPPQPLTAHTAAYTAKQGRFGWGWYHYPRTVLRGSEPLRAQRLEEHSLPSLHGPRERRKEAESLRCGILHCTNELRGFAIVMTECGEKFC